jgi:hypothetical protein
VHGTCSSLGRSTTLRSTRSAGSSRMRCTRCTCQGSLAGRTRRNCWTLACRSVGSHRRSSHLRHRRSFLGKATCRRRRAWSARRCSPARHSLKWRRCTSFPRGSRLRSRQSCTRRRRRSPLGAACRCLPRNRSSSGTRCIRGP